MIRPIITLAAVAACQALPADELPNPQLLPTTRAIHGIIAKHPAPEPGAMERYKEILPQAKDAKFKLIPIPGGTFKFGSPDNEAGRNPDEGPQREVTIDPFWMGEHEVTWDLYRAFMENGKSRNKDGTLNRDANPTTSEPPAATDPDPLNDTITQPTPPYVPMHFQMGDGYSKEYPAVGMTQHAASKFCEWISAQTGKFYRLPTEAEWEYAARAGTTTAYSFGDDPASLPEHAWFADNSEFQYQRVGSRKPNPWGLHDMHGNVAEHVLDQYVADAHAKLGKAASNPWNPPTVRYPTVVRGGHWDADAPALRSAARLASSKAWKIQDPQIPKSIWYFTDAPWLGFRIVRPLKTPPPEEMHRYWNSGPGAGE